MYLILLLLFKRYHTCNGARVDFVTCFGRVLGPFSKENPKIVKPRKSWVVLQPSFRFSHLCCYCCCCCCSSSFLLLKEMKARSCFLLLFKVGIPPCPVVFGWWFPLPNEYTWRGIRGPTVCSSVLVLALATNNIVLIGLLCEAILLLRLRYFYFRACFAGCAQKCVQILPKSVQSLQQVFDSIVGCRHLREKIQII